MIFKSQVVSLIFVQNTSIQMATERQTNGNQMTAEIDKKKTMNEQQKNKQMNGEQTLNEHRANIE